MSKAMMGFGAFTVALSVGIVSVVFNDTAALMVGFGTLTAILVDENSE